MPKTEAALQTLAEQIGRDGQHLLEQIEAETQLEWLKQLPALITLSQVWQQQYIRQPTIQWRHKDKLPASALLISTPYDPQARYSRKREMNWTGYKVHLTETCEADTPHLITHVETTEAPKPDNTVVDTIHAVLEEHQLIPRDHVVDAAYVISATLVSSKERHINLLGPVNTDNSWQTKADDGFDMSHLYIDWEHQTVKCPDGQRSERWFDHHA